MSTDTRIRHRLSTYVSIAIDTRFVCHRHTFRLPSKLVTYVIYIIRYSSGLISPTDTFAIRAYYCVSPSWIKLTHLYIDRVCRFETFRTVGLPVVRCQSFCKLYFLEPASPDRCMLFSVQPAHSDRQRCFPSVSKAGKWRLTDHAGNTLNIETDT